MELQGKTAFITGGSKGIGRAIAEQMLQAGMNVGITGISINSLNLVTDELKAQYGDKIVSFESDVRDYTAQQSSKRISS